MSGRQTVALLMVADPVDAQAEVARARGGAAQEMRGIARLGRVVARQCRNRPLESRLLFPRPLLPNPAERM
jgi:hypothetical protein